MPIIVYVCIIILNTLSTFPSIGHSPKAISNYKWSDGYKDDIQKMKSKEQKTKKQV